MRKFLSLAAAAVVAGSMIPASAAANVAVAEPGAAVAGYATPRLVFVKSLPATFVNLDPLQPHDIVSVRTNSSGKPLFASKVIQAGETAPINGVSALAPGDYVFFCTIHETSMRGVATVVA